MPRRRPPSPCSPPPSPAKHGADRPPTQAAPCAALASSRRRLAGAGAAAGRADGSSASRLQRGTRGVRKHRDGGRRARPDLQQRLLRRLSLGASQRRRQCDHRHPVRQERAGSIRSPRRVGRLAAAAVRHRPGGAGTGPGRGQCRRPAADRAALRRRPDRSDRRCRDPPQCGADAARRDQRPRRGRRRRRQRPASHRPLRLEGAARQPAWLRRRRVSQRDGRHRPLLPAR